MNLQEQDRKSEGEWIEEIHLLDYWKVVRKRLSIAVTVFCAVVLGVVVYLLVATPVYEARSQILITEDLSRSVVNAELAQSVFNDQMRFETELQILNGDPIYQDVLLGLKLTVAEPGTEEFARALVALKGNVQTKRLRNTRLLELRASSASPDTAALVVNTVMQVYIDRYRSRQLESSRNTASWLNDQLLDLEYKVRKSQQELLDYISSEKITFVSDGTGLESELKSDLFKAPEEVLLEDIHTRLIQAKLARDEVLQRYRDRHPKLVQAEAAVTALEREFELEKERLERERGLLVDKIIEARKKAVQYDILKRQVDTNKELFNLFTKKMQEVDLTQGLGEGDIRVIEAATVPLIPAKPKKKLLLLLSLVVGAFAGIGAAFLTEYMDRSLKSREEIEELTGLPVLSSINLLMHDKERRSFDYQHYFTDHEFRKEHELFRVLRANIKFSDLKSRSGVLLVTSSCPGEGKTTISTRLALNLAAAGEKVLLIDADLRKPTVHKHFSLENKQGLSSMMVEEIPDQSAIRRQLIPGLDVITSGPIPAQPTELIENSRLGELIADFARIYDRVVIDSPPVGTVIDAALLATMCQGVLLVIDPKTSDRHILRQAKAQLERVDVRILGTVLNKISQDSEGYQYYYYYSSYYGEDGEPSGKKRSHQGGRRSKSDRPEKVSA